MKYPTKTVDRVVAIGAMVERLQSEIKMYQGLRSDGWLNGAGEQHIGRQIELCEGQVNAGMDAITDLLAADVNKVRDTLKKLVLDLEDQGFSLDAGQLPVAGCIPDDAPVQINGGDVVDFLNVQYPLLKALL